MNGDLAGAKQAALGSVEYLETAKPLLEQLKATGSSDADEYISRYGPMRLQGYRLMGKFMLVSRIVLPMRWNSAKLPRYSRTNRVPGKCFIEYWNCGVRMKKLRQLWKEQKL